MKFNINFFGRALGHSVGAVAFALLSISSAHAGAGIHRHVFGNIWTKIDGHPDTVSITASNGMLVKTHSDGRLFRFVNGTWEMIGNSSLTRQVAIASDIYQRLSNGFILRFTGTPCSGETCTGWELLDNNGWTADIVASKPSWLGSDTLIQKHASGAIFKFTGQPCSATGCPGWQMLDNNPNTHEVVTDGDAVYQKHYNGFIYRFVLGQGRPCDNVTCYDWSAIDTNSATATISLHGSPLIQRHGTGALFARVIASSGAWTWRMIDHDSRIMQAESRGTPFLPNSGMIYKLRTEGSIHQLDMRQCTTESCPSWRTIHSGNKTFMIQSDGNSLFRLDRD